MENDRNKKRKFRGNYIFNFISNEPDIFILNEEIRSLCMCLHVSHNSTYFKSN